MSRQRILILVTAVVGWGLFIPATYGQSPAPAAPVPSKIFTRNKSFCLPIALDAKDRAKVQSVQLYVRNGAQSSWTLKESVPASRNEFDYSVTEDGEYWFTIVTMKKNDKLVPADLSRMVPGLIVVVDSQPPEVTVQALAATAQGIPVECKVRDANPDPSRLKLEYQTADKTWHVLPPSARDPGVFILPGPMNKESVVRATATDRAGNSTMRVVNLDTSAAATVNKSKETAAVPDLLETRAERTPSPIGEQSKTPPPLAEPLKNMDRFAPEQPTVAGRQLINSTHVSLDYQIEQQGPTGVSKVEVWITRDEGQTWRRLCEDPHHRSPVELDLPGDGQYGIVLVATNGSGFGAKPPGKGDVPDYWIEVDTTKPVAQLLSAKPSAGDAGAVLLITWVASDKNLGDNPVDLYYATRPSGPWLAIAKGVKNDGNYLWNLPPDIGAEFYVRMEVTDRAGNMERCETPQPVAVDLSRPKARVVRIRAAAR